MPEDTGNSMKQKLAAGELVFCMNLRLARSVDIAMVAKAGGYDALYVDMEHSPYSIETTSTICAAALGMASHRWCGCRAMTPTGRAECSTVARRVSSFRMSTTAVKPRRWCAIAAFLPSADVR